MKVIVVGAGGTTRDLLHRLGALWEVTVVDADPGRLAAARRVRSIEAVQGDGSSLVVLTRAGLAEADAVVAATLDDEANLEVCRLARRAGLLRVAAVAASPERLPEYRQMRVAAYAGDTLAAAQLEEILEPRPVSSTAFAAGRAEAVEFRIAADSPVHGRALRDLGSGTWLVAAIRRGDRLIVPHGETALEVGDLVTVVGAASDYPVMVRTFTAAEARFPLEYGRSVAVALEQPSDLAVVMEAIALARDSHATAAVVVHRRPEDAGDEAHAAEVAVALEAVADAAGDVEVRPRSVAGVPGRALAGVILEESIGAVVLPAPAPGRMGRVRVIRAVQAAAALGRPVLLARGTHPFREILTPVSGETIGGAARAALDLAARGRRRVSAVAAVSAGVPGGVEAGAAGMRALERFREEAVVQGVPVRRHVARGGLLRVVETAAADADLLVLGLPARHPTLLRPGPIAPMLQRVRCSVLMVPEP